MSTSSQLLVSGSEEIYGSSNWGAAQHFTDWPISTITSVDFKMCYERTAPTGTCYCRVWDAAGNVLGTIGSKDVSTLPNGYANLAYQRFNASPVSIPSIQDIWIGIEYKGGDSTHRISVADKGGNPVAGSIEALTSSSAWGDISGYDLAWQDLTWSTVTSYDLSASDGLTGGEALTPDATLSPSTADGLKLAEVLALASSLSPVAVDGAAAGDAPAGAVTINPTATDGVTLADVLAALNTLSLSTSDGVAVAEALASLVTAGVSLSDAFAMSDILAMLVQPLPSLSEGLSLSETLAALSTLGLLSSDGLVLGGTAPIATMRDLLVAEGFSAGDALAIALALSPTATDGVNGAESLSPGLAIFPVASDGSILADASASGIILQLTLADGTILTENLSLAVSLAQAITDGVLAGDVASIHIGEIHYVYVTASDGLKLAEVLASLANAYPAASDGLVGADATTLTCSTGRTWGSIKVQDGCRLEDMTIVGQGISNEHIVYSSTAIATDNCMSMISRVRVSGAGGRNFYIINSLPYTYVLDVTLNDCESVNSIDTASNDGGVYLSAVNYAEVNSLYSSNNRCKAVLISLANNSVARVVDLHSDTDAGGIKMLNAVSDSYYAGRKVDIVNPYIYNCGNMGIEASGMADSEYLPVTITGGVIDKASGNALDAGGGRGWKVQGIRVTRTNFGGAGWAQLSNGTGTFTGSPIKLNVGANTIACTVAGTATVRLPAGAATSTAASGTATVTGSPVTLSAQFNTITTEGTGTITITVVDTSIEGCGFTNGSECSFIGCTFENNWRAGINFWQNDRNVIQGCTIRNNNQNADSTHFGVTLWAYTAGDTCYNNTVQGCIIGDDQTLAAKTLTDNATAASKVVEVGTSDLDYFFAGQYVHVVEGATDEYNWVDYVDASGITLLYALADNYTTSATIAGIATQDYGIYEHENDGDTDYNTYIGNQLYGNITGAIHQHGTHDIIQGNYGWTTEAEGTGTLLNGQTSVIISHGLSATPTNVSIVWRENPTNAIADWWISAENATAFTLNGVDPGASNLDFWWGAEV